MSEVIPNTSPVRFSCVGAITLPADRKDHLMLLRKYVSRKARGKERGVLKGVQLASHTIDECFNDHPLDDEEAVQDGLTRWCEGLGTQPPTWGVLIAAMEHAEIELHSVRGLKERLGLLGTLLHQCTVLCTCACLCMVLCAACDVWCLL